MNVEQPLAYDIPGAVKASGIGRTKIFEAIKRGQLTARKYGKKTLILPEDLVQFLANLPVKEVEEGGD